MIDNEYETQLGEFQWKCIQARLSNRKACIETKAVKEVNNKCYYEGREIFTMTPQEELFAKLFNHEKSLVKDMNDLELAAHIEELSKISYEARARLTASKDEQKERKPRTAKGFERSLTTDDTSSEAINAIKGRKDKLTKADKIIESLVKLGMTREDAEAKMSAGTLLAQLRNKDKEKEDKIQFKNTPQRLSDEIDSVKAEEASKPIVKVVNPFEKKDKA